MGNREGTWMDATAKRAFADESKEVKRVIPRIPMLAHVGIKCPVCGEKYSSTEKYQGVHVCSVG